MQALSGRRRVLKGDTCGVRAALTIAESLDSLDAAVQLVKRLILLLEQARCLF